MMVETNPKEYIAGLMKKGEAAGRLSKEEFNRLSQTFGGLDPDNQAKLARMIKRKGAKDERD